MCVRVCGVHAVRVSVCLWEFPNALWFLKRMRSFKCLLHVQVIGCLVHGHTPNAHVFLNTEFSGETNTNIECLRRALEGVFTQRRADGKEVPVNLAIQMDNTTKDNKNRRYILCLCLLECVCVRAAMYQRSVR